MVRVIPPPPTRVGASEVVECNLDAKTQKSWPNFKKSGATTTETVQLLMRHKRGSPRRCVPTGALPDTFGTSAAAPFGRFPCEVRSQVSVHKILHGMLCTSPHQGRQASSVAHPATMETSPAPSFPIQDERELETLKRRQQK